MHALKVPKKEAESVKAQLAEKDVLDKSRLPEAEGDHVLFPIIKKIDSDYEIVERELEEKEKTLEFKEILEGELDEEELEHLKTSQDLIGDIAIIEISPELESRKKQIAEALIKAKPYIRTVLKKGKHEGEFRTQELEFLAGEDRRETVHKENGVRLKVDVEEVYFSPRLAHDREQVAAMVNKGEEVLVLFSGCGPYTCVIAKNTEAGKVTGVEINPVAHRYTLENIMLNKLSNADAILGDVGEILPKLDMFDRIVMAGPEHAKHHLEEALKHVKPGGTIHYYDFMDEEEIEEKAREASSGNELLGWEKAGQVSPDRYRVRVDIKVK